MTMITKTMIVPIEVWDERRPDDLRELNPLILSQCRDAVLGPTPSLAATTEG